MTAMLLRAARDRDSTRIRAWARARLGGSVALGALLLGVTACGSPDEPHEPALPQRGLETAWWAAVEDITEPPAAPDAPPPPIADEPVCQASIPGDVLFAVDSAEISELGMAAIRELAAEIPSGDGPVVVEGHTDSTGSVEHNDRLSRLRAEAVAAALAGLGVAPDRLSVTGLGATQPRADESGSDPEQARALNRRVTVDMTCPAS